MNSIEDMVQLEMEEIIQKADHGIWTTASDKDIGIKDMTTQHIINALNFIRRDNDKFLLDLYEDQFKREIERRRTDHKKRRLNYEGKKKRIFHKIRTTCFTRAKEKGENEILEKKSSRRKIFTNLKGTRNQK